MTQATRVPIVLMTPLLWAGLMQGASRYHVDDFCYPQYCSALALNNNGAVIGSVTTGPLNLSPLGVGFVYYPGVGLSVMDSGLGPVTAPTSLNDAGVVVGSSTGNAFAYLPNSNGYLRLPGMGANHINNRGDVTGPGAPHDLIPGYDVFELLAIADDGTIIGDVFGANNGTYTIAATPGFSPVVMPECVCRTNGGYFNNRGQVITNFPTMVLYTPGSGVRPVPVGSAFRAYGISDSGLVLLNNNVDSKLYIYDSTGGFGIGNEPVALDSMMAANTQWSFTGGGTPYGSSSYINSQGAILVFATSSSGRQTFVKLVPE